MNKVVAKTLIKDANGLILVLHRSKTHPKFAEHFDLPGGEVEKTKNGQKLQQEKCSKKRA